MEREKKEQGRVRDAQKRWAAGEKATPGMNENNEKFRESQAHDFRFAYAPSLPYVLMVAGFPENPGPFFRGVETTLSPLSV